MVAFAAELPVGLSDLEVLDLPPMGGKVPRCEMYLQMTLNSSSVITPSLFGSN